MWIQINCWIHLYCSSYSVHPTIRWKEYSIASEDSVGDVFRHIVCGAKHAGEQSSLFTRMAVLEARAAKRFKIGIVAFFPFMFFVFGLVLGKMSQSL